MWHCSRAAAVHLHRCVSRWQCRARALTPGIDPILLLDLLSNVELIVMDHNSQTVSRFKEMLKILPVNKLLHNQLVMNNATWGWQKK